jgi:hypothetical protein
VARDWDGQKILLIAHSANRWFLDYLLHGAALEDLVGAPFAWQEGWHYTPAHPVERPVRPILAAALPDVPHSAALLGPGSDVLGFDTPRSSDHDWGPRLLLFLHPDERAGHGQRLHDRLAYELPTTFAGYSTHFPPAGAV